MCVYLIAYDIRTYAAWCVIIDAKNLKRFLLRNVTILVIKKKDKHIVTINELNKGNKYLYFNINLLQEITITHNVTLYYYYYSSSFFFVVKIDSLSS